MIDNGTQTHKTSQELTEKSGDHTHGNPEVFERLRQSIHLPPLPPIASQIMKMCREEDTTVEQLAKLMSQDPAVVARLLQIANSSYYGGVRHAVTSIAHAITLLGMDAVSSLALSFCFYRLCRDIDHPGSPGMDHVKFWRRSIITSIAGRTVGKWCNVADPEFVFLASLLQDIGLLALNSVDPKIMHTLTRDANGDHARLSMLEKQHFGCDHTTVGSWVAKSWDLPEAFHTTITASHNPLEYESPTTEERATVRCVAFAGQLAEVWCCSKDTVEHTIQEVAGVAKDWLDLDPEEIQAIFSLIPDRLSEMSSFFQVHIGSAEDIARPAELATMLLVPDPKNETVSTPKS